MFNERQLQAINSDPLKNTLVLAPPGSGKTSVIVERVKKLLEWGYHPRVITFTNKAVGEVSDRLPPGIDALTLHGEAISFLKGFNYKFIKDPDSNPDDLLELATSSILDSDLNLGKTVYLIDEYQDTDHIQFDFISSLRSVGATFFVVGDPNQSIYSFRGGSLEYITSFEKDFEANKIELNINYRSSEEIVNLSNFIISTGSDNFFQEMPVSFRGGCSSFPLHVRLQDDVQEAFFIFKSFQNWVIRGGDPKEFAVIARKNSLLDALPKFISMFMETKDYCTKSSYPFSFFKGLQVFTSHGCKGLEFECVVVMASEEGFFPEVRANSPRALNEELRMFYVAVTRAKTNLVFISVNSRHVVTFSRNFHQTKSRFLRNVPESLLKDEKNYPLISSDVMIGDRFLYNGKKSFVKKVWADNALCFVSGTGGLLIKQSVISEILKKNKKKVS